MRYGGLFKFKSIFEYIACCSGPGAAVTVVDAVDATGAAYHDINLTLMILGKPKGTRESAGPAFGVNGSWVCRIKRGRFPDLAAVGIAVYVITINRWHSIAAIAIAADDRPPATVIVTKYRVRKPAGSRKLAAGARVYRATSG